MPKLKSPIGQASAANLRSAPGRSSGKRSGYISAVIDRDSMQRVFKMLREVDPKVRKKIASDSLRKWGREVRKAARGFAYKHADRTKKQLFTKVKTYKRAVWCAVGVKAEKVKNTRPEQRLGRYSPFVGWKAHFMEVGWHSWPKGRGGNATRVEQILRNKEIDEGRGKVIKYKRTVNGKVITQATKERKRKVSASSSRGGGGRGWKRGLRGYRGVYQSQYARHYHFKAAGIGMQIAPRLIIEGIRLGIEAAQKGRAA